MQELDFTTEEGIAVLETHVTQKLREKMTARMVYPVVTEQKGDQPVIHKNMIYNPDTFEEDIEKLATEFVDAEDRLLFSGETDGWKALGIEGLSTATGRYSMCASGSWPVNAVDDIIDAKKHLQLDAPFILIVPPDIGADLDRILWRDPEHDLPPITYRNFLEQEKIVGGIITAKSLYSSRDTQDSVLVVQPGMDSFYAEQGLSLETLVYENKETGEWHITVRETIRPVIKNPSSIVEISHLLGR